MPTLWLALLILLLAGCTTPPPGAASRDTEAPDSTTMSDSNAPPDASDVPDFSEAPGVVRVLEIGAPLLVVYPDAEPGTRFCLDAEALPADLQQDGARVVFTGNREEIPPNYRLACAPFELIEIRPEP